MPKKQAVLSVTIGEPSDILGYLRVSYFRDLLHISVNPDYLKSDEEQLEKACAEILAKLCGQAGKEPTHTSYSGLSHIDYFLRSPRSVKSILTEWELPEDFFPRQFVERGLMHQDGTLTVYGRKVHMFYKYDSRAAPTLVIASPSQEELSYALVCDTGRWDKSLKAKLTRVKQAVPSEEAFVKKLAGYLEELLDMPLTEYFAAIGNTRERMDRLLADKMLPPGSSDAATYYDVIRISHNLRNICETSTDAIERGNLQNLNEALLCELSKPLFEQFRKQCLEYEKEQAQQAKENTDKPQKQPADQRDVHILAKPFARKQIKFPENLPPCFILSTAPISYYYHAASRRTKNRYANAIYNDVFASVRGSRAITGTLETFLYHFAYVMPNDEEENGDYLPYLLAILVDPICLPHDIRQDKKQ